jgi:hypothetical protein
MWNPFTAWLEERKAVAAACQANEARDEKRREERAAIVAYNLDVRKRETAEARDRAHSEYKVRKARHAAGEAMAAERRAREADDDLDTKRTWDFD